MILFFGAPSNTKLGHMLSFSSGVMMYIHQHSSSSPSHLSPITHYHYRY